MKRIIEAEGFTLSFKTNGRSISQNRRKDNSFRMFGDMLANMIDEGIEDFETYCKDYIINQIESDCLDYDKPYFSDELYYELTRGANCDGSVTYSTYKARLYMIAWWGDVIDFQEETDECLLGNFDPFGKPELSMVIMVIEKVRDILCQLFDENPSLLCDDLYIPTPSRNKKLIKCLNSLSL